MASPQSSTKEVAPLRIAELYEQFKRAVKNSDFHAARTLLQEMRQYQGGEKLAKELASDFETMQEEFSHPEFHKMIEEEDDDELRAQRILSHIDLFESFLRDKNFENAILEIEFIASLGDQNLAQTLQKRCDQEKKKAIQKGFFQQAAKITESTDEHVLNQEYEKVQIILNQDETKEFQKNLKSEFLKALDQGRTTYAQNLLKKMLLTVEENAKLQVLLEQKKSASQEGRRKQKTLAAWNEMRQSLETKDFKTAEKILTKCRHFMDATEFAQIESTYQTAFSDDSKRVGQNIYDAILKNIEEKDFVMAHSNLKDFRKIADGHRAKEMEEIVLRAEFGEKKEKKQEVSLKKLEARKKIQELFEKAQGSIAQKDWETVSRLAREISRCGDKILSSYLTKQKAALQSQEDEEQKAQEILQWKKDFHAFLQGETSINRAVLLKRASFLFLRKEFYAYAQVIERHQRYEDVRIAINEHDFALAKKIVRKITEDINERQQLALQIFEKEAAYQESLKQGNVRIIVNAIESLCVQQKYDEAEQEAKRLLDINAQDVYDETLSSIAFAKMQDHITEIQAEVEQLKSKGLFKEALKVSEEALHLKQKSAYEQMQYAIQKEEEHFLQKKKDSVFAYVLSEIQKRNFIVLKLKAKQLTKDQILDLQKYVLIEKQKIQDEKVQGKYQLLEEEFLYAEQHGSVAMQAVLEKMHKLMPEKNTDGYMQKIHDKRQDEEKKSLLDKQSTIGVLLKVGDFRKVRTLAQSLLDSGYVAEANQAFKQCLQAEHEYELEIRSRQFKTLYNQFLQFRSNQSNDLWTSFLLEVQEFFHDGCFQVQVQEIAQGLEEWVVHLIEQQQFSEAHYCIKFLGQIEPEKASKLAVIAQERKTLYLKQYNLVGAKDFIQKKSIIAHYQAWKEASAQGVFDDKHREQIELLGDTDLGRALTQFQIHYEHQHRWENAVIKFSHSDDKLSLENFLKDHFFECPSKTLAPLVSRYVALSKHEHDMQYSSNANMLEDKVMKYLQENQFTQARSCCTKERLQSLRPDKAKRILENINHAEKAFTEAQEISFKKNFDQYLAEKNWEEAESALCTLPVDQVAKHIQDLFQAQNDQAIIELKEQFVSEKKAIEQDIQADNFQMAYDRFKKLEQNIPYEIFIEERGLLIKQLKTAYEAGIQELKISLYGLIEKNQFELAQKMIVKLNALEDVFHTFTQDFQTKDSVFEQCFTSVKQSMNENNVQKARTMIDAVEGSVTQAQYKYLLFWLDQAQSKESANPYVSYQAIQEALAKGQRDTVEKLLQKAEEDFPHKQVVFVSLKNRLQEMGAEMQEQIQYQSCLQAIKTGQFTQAENLILSLPVGNDYVDACAQLSLAKKELLQKKLQVLFNGIQARLPLHDEKIGTDIQELEDSYLDALFFYGEDWLLSSLAEIFQNILLDKKLFKQDEMAEALTQKKYVRVKKLLQNMPYQRLRLWYLSQIVEDQEHDASLQAIQAVSALRTLLQNNQYDQVRVKIGSVTQWHHIEDIDTVFLPLLEHEALQADAERDRTLRDMMNDIFALLSGNQIIKAEKILVKARKLAVAEELVQCEEMLQEKKQNQKKEVMRTEKEKEENIKKYEKFVLEALSQYNFQEADRYIQEITALEGAEKMESLKNAYKKSKLAYYKEQRIIQLKQEIEAFCGMYELQKAQEKIQELAGLDQSAAEIMQRLILSVQVRDKHEVIEEHVRQLIKNKKFHEAEILLEKL